MLYVAKGLNNIRTSTQIKLNHPCLNILHMYDTCISLWSFGVKAKSSDPDQIGCMYTFGSTQVAFVLKPAFVCQKPYSLFVLSFHSFFNNIFNTLQFYQNTSKTELKYFDYINTAARSTLSK